jgi:hypothetical protein
MVPSTKAFFDELEKISKKETASKKKGRVVVPLLSTGAALGAGVGGGTALGAVPSAFLAKHLIRSETLGPARTTMADVDRLRRAITDKPEVFHAPPAGITHAAYAPSHQVRPTIKLVVGPERAERAMKHGLVLSPGMAGPHITAHEFGHARFGQGRVGKALQAFRTKVPRWAQSLMLTAPGITASATDPESGVSKYAPVAGAAAAAPHLIDEATASILAQRGMRRAGYAAPALRRAALQNLKAFGTYALPIGAMAVGAPLIARAVKKKTEKKLRGEKS